ncbi:uncharacterized protein LOC132704022 [Cylas formicarius]|uniref:uncharacterized protein LOC132704022 n=1 Tax=Cylas formicarius TaxID=197179 RepID=UPI002958774D|nr:uncharacterized protein LOC132704022 [Cylas formicarius]
MNDEILQHHFDEVFSALQDKENFEIFTKIKHIKTPRVKRTFFKIMSPSDMPANWIETEEELSLSERIPRTYCGEDPSSRRYQTTRSGKIIERPKSPLVGLRGLKDNGTGDASLNQCRHCKRYFVGDFFDGHEVRCIKGPFGSY